MKERILFLSLENACRSQMLEAWLRHMAPERYDVCSAGTQPAAAVHPLAIEIMREVDIDISGQHPRPIQEVMDKPFDLVIAVSEEALASCPALPGTPGRFYWSFDDPTGATGEKQEHRDPLYAFRRTREEVKARLVLWQEIDSREDIPTSWKRVANKPSSDNSSPNNS